MSALWPYDPRCASGPTEGTPVWKAIFPAGHALATGAYRLTLMAPVLAAKSKPGKA
jgi:hypothetical protein